MCSKTVIVFGSGVAGLSAAHHLVDKGYKVTIIETLGVPGGMARSDRYGKESVPTEYSWRGMAGNWYVNTYNILRQIPYKNSTVYATQLSKPLKFHLVSDNNNNFVEKQVHDKNFHIPNSWRLTPTDKIKLAWIFAQGWFSSDVRNEEVYANQSMYNTLKKHLSEEGSRTFAWCFGPFIGVDAHRADSFHVFEFFKKNLLYGGKHWHYDEEEDKYWVQKRRVGWSIMKGPTSEVWFNPWVDYLKEKGVEFRFEHTLDIINYDGNKITSTDIITKDENKYSLSADYYVLAITPFAVKEILDKSPSNLLLDSELKKFAPLTSFGEHRQISFRLIFRGEHAIKIPSKEIGIILTDSEFDITFFSCSDLYNKDQYIGDGVKTLWSGTATIESNPGKLYGLPMKNLTKEQFIAEIEYQIYKSKTLDNLIRGSNNGKGLKDFELFEIEVWHGWIFPDSTNGLKEVIGHSKKWVNDIGSYKHQPSVQTSIPNLLLAGAHCRSNGDLYSMETACETGRKAAFYITGQDDVIPQQKPYYLEPFQDLDSVLYKLGLPNVFNLIWIFLLCILIISYIVFNRPTWMLIIILIMIGLTVIVLT